MRYRLAIVIILFCFTALGNKANNTITEIKTNSLNHSLFYHCDSTNVLTYEGLHTLEKVGKNLVNGSGNFGIRKYPVWFWTTLLNNTENEEWIIHIDYPILDKLLIIIEGENGKPDTLFQSGYFDMVTINNIEYNTYYCKIDLPKEKPIKLTIRSETSGFLIFPVKITPYRDFFIQGARQNHIWYTIYGMVVAAMLFNLILLFLTKEKNFLLLTLFLALLLINSHYQYNIGFNMWVTLPDYILQRIRFLIFGATSIVAFIYTISYLELKNSKKLYNLYLFLIIVISIFTILVATKLIKAHHSNFASPFMYLSGTFIMLITGIIRYKDLKIPSLFYLSSFGLFFISSLVWMLVLLDVIHYSIFLYHINSIVVGLFSIVLSIGLFDKISTLKTEKIRVAELELSNNKLKAEIIEREAIELLLEESENKFRLLFEWSPLAVSITDYQKGLFLDVNRKFCELAGLSKIQIIGRNSFELEFFSMADREIILQHVQNNKENLGVEFDFKLKNNKLIHSIIYPYKMNLKGKPVIITIISDITQVKQNQKEIKKLLTAIEQSANTVLITNNKGIIEFVNPYFINLTGYLPEEVIGKTPSILKSGYHPPDFYSNIWKTIKNGEKWVGEFYNKKKNGDFYWESATITPITNDNGNITHFMAIKEDITEKKQQQIILVDSERKLKELNATKDKFFSIIAHDLMNPFNALLGFSSLTVETVQNQEHDKTAKYIVYIDKLAKQISNLFQNLLIWSRAQSGNLLFTPMPVDICEVISDTVNLVEQIALKKNIRIHYEKKAPLKLMIDQNMISTVVRNLVSNAIKFSNNGGNIYITTEKLDKFFLLIISDDGIGMDANIVNELFRIDKTHTTKGTEDETGTGLGLVICKEFIDMHKGKIWAESTPGKGSRFFVKIPLN